MRKIQSEKTYLLSLCNCGIEDATYSHKNKRDFIFIIMIDKNIFSVTDFTRASFDAFYSFLVQNTYIPCKDSYYYVNMYMYTYIYIQFSTDYLTNHEKCSFLLFFQMFLVEAFET